MRLIVTFFAGAMIAVGCDPQAARTPPSGSGADATTATSDGLFARTPGQGARPRIADLRAAARATRSGDRPFVEVHRSDAGIVRSVHAWRGTIPVPAGTSADPGSVARAFLVEWQDALGLTAIDARFAPPEAHPLRSGKRASAKTDVVRFQQVSACGHPVFRGHIQLLIDRDTLGLRSYTANVAPVGNSCGVAAVDEADARARAAYFVGTSRPAAASELGVFSPAIFDVAAGDARLAWKVEIAGTQQWEVFLDAATGDLLAAFDTTKYFEASPLKRRVVAHKCGDTYCGDLPPYLSGVCDVIGSDPCISNLSDDFEDPTTLTLVYDDDEQPAKQPGGWPGNSEVVHFSIKALHAYFEGDLMRDGWDDEGGKYIAEVDFKKGKRSRPWEGGIRLTTQDACLDIVAHEFFHKAQTAGSFDEQHVQLLSQLAESHAGKTDWLVGATPSDLYQGQVALDGSCTVDLGGGASTQIGFQMKDTEIGPADDCILCPWENHLSNFTRWTTCGDCVQASCDSCPDSQVRNTSPGSALSILHKAGWLLGQEEEASMAFAGVEVEPIDHGDMSKIYFNASALLAAADNDFTAYRNALISTAINTDGIGTHTAMQVEQAMDAIGTWRAGGSQLDDGSLNAGGRISSVDFTFGGSDHQLAFYRDETTDDVRWAICPDGSACQEQTGTDASLGTTASDPTAVVLDGVAVYVFFADPHDTVTPNLIKYRVMDSSGDWLSGVFDIGATSDASPAALTNPGDEIGVVYKVPGTGAQQLRSTSSSVVARADDEPGHRGTELGFALGALVGWGF
jgi:hypothetical protein